MSDWNIPKEYLDQSKAIERLKAEVAKLEAEVKALWLEKIERTNIATHPVDGYCGKRSSKAGLQAGETEHE
jgi:multidrug resistance efflux pump